MAKIDDVQAAAVKYRERVDAFIARAKADFENIKEQLAALGVNDAKLDALQATLDGGITAVDSQDLDPNFPAPPTPPV